MTPVIHSENLRVGAAAAALLGDVVTRCRQRGPGAVAVFDLDSTLLDNRPRQALIARAFGEERNLSALRGAAPTHWIGWSQEQSMQRMGMTAEEIAAVRDDYRAFWLERFFTSEYCQHDIAIAGAARFLSVLFEVGARIVYVTGRHEGMRAGSIESFRGAGFPLPSQHGSRAPLLLMKPTLDESDDDFKARTHAELRELGPVATAFDNEPTHVNGYRLSFPEALVVHLATDHSPRSVQVDARIPSIPDFAPDFPLFAAPANLP